MEPRTIADLERKPEDATWAAMSYGSFLAGHLLVSLAALVLTRDKSEYARFHALQVLVAHITAMLGLSLLGIGLGLFFFLSVGATIATAAAHPHGGPPPPFFFLAMFPTVICFGFGTFVTSFFTAIAGIMRTLSLRDFTMPIIGPWVFRRFFAGKRGAPTVTS